MGIYYTAYAAWGWQVQVPEDTEDVYEWAEEKFKDAPEGIKFLTLGHYDITDPESLPVLMVLDETRSTECYDTVVLDVPSPTHGQIKTALQFAAEREIVLSPDGCRLRMGVSVG